MTPPGKSLPRDRDPPQARGARRQRRTKRIRGLRGDGSRRAVEVHTPEPDKEKDLFDDFPPPDERE